MTQNGGLDILFAWCMFGILVLVLAWLVLRRHDDPRQEISRPEPLASDTGDEDDREKKTPTDES
jgi:hypothetical protein